MQREPDPLDEVFLHAHPNPKRVGCPPEEILQQLARRKLPLTHTAFSHVAECSECFRDVKEYQVRRARSRKLYASAVAACVAMVIIAALALWAIRWPRGTQLSGPVTLVDTTIDLWEHGAIRGGDRAGGAQIGSLPSAVVRLRVVLPRTSEAGLYRIAVSRNEDGTDLIVGSSAQSVAEGEKQVVTVILDLRATRGAYFLQTADQQRVSYAYRLQIG